jgi:hypothetical protein
VLRRECLDAILVVGRASSTGQFAEHRRVKRNGSSARRAESAMTASPANFSIVPACVIDVLCHSVVERIEKASRPF